MLKNESILDFGLVIAYIFPGCVVLGGVAAGFSVVERWLAGAIESAAFGGFLYFVLASVGAGLTASTVRWLMVDSLLHLTGIRPPAWDFARLTERTEAYLLLIENHYRYYQFYSNTLVAIIFAYACWRLGAGSTEVPLGVPELGFSALASLFAAASRNTLRNYYARAGALLMRDQADEKQLTPSQPV